VHRKWLPIFLVLLGALLGAGGAGEWHRRQWAKVEHIRAVREQMEAHLLRMAELYRQHAALLHAERALYTDHPGSPSLTAAIHRLWTQEFPMINDNIEHCELLLSRLEHRPPKAYHFRPPPPLQTPSPVAYKKKTIQGPSGGGRKPARGPHVQKVPPRSPPTTRGDLWRDDTLDRTHMPTE
jgi:hypothetical protein